MAEGCDREPVEEITVTDNGILLVYAVCSQHVRDLRWGAMVAHPVNRGLIGLA